MQCSFDLHKNVKGVFEIKRIQFTVNQKKNIQYICVHIHIDSNKASRDLKIYGKYKRHVYI